MSSTTDKLLQQLIDNSTETNRQVSMLTQSIRESLGQTPKSIPAPSVAPPVYQQAPPPPAPPAPLVNYSMHHVALVVGHSERSRGAAGGGVNEYDFNNILVDNLATKLIKLGFKVSVVMRKNGLRALPDEINKLNPNLVISFHCNAFNTDVTGCETLYYHDSVKGKRLAKLIQTKVNGTVGNFNRGIKPKHSEDRGGYLLRYVNAPAVITEPFFIDALGDRAKGMRVRDNGQLVDAYAKAIVEYVI